MSVDGLEWPGGSLYNCPVREKEGERGKTSTVENHLKRGEDLTSTTIAGRSAAPSLDPTDYIPSIRAAVQRAGGGQRGLSPSRLGFTLHCSDDGVVVVAAAASSAEMKEEAEREQKERKQGGRKEGIV